MRERRRKRILIIDDDPMQLEYYMAVLEQDYDIMTAAGLGEAIAILAGDTTVDGLICDLHLGGGCSGMELLAWIGEHGPELMEHSVIISGDLVVNTGIYTVPVVFKPVEPDVLLQTMQQALNPMLEVNVGAG